MPANTSVEKALTLIKSDPSKVLGFKVGQQTIDKGTYIPRKEAQSAPSEFTLPNLDQSKTYFIICLDLDAPFVNAPILGPILHWVQPNFKPTPSPTNDNTIATTSRPIADFIGPAPPPFSGPHRYTFFLYEQPASLDVSKLTLGEGQAFAVTKRMFTSLDELEKKYSLGSCIACNYFNSN